MIPAPKDTLTYGELREWLRLNGVGDTRFRKLLANGVIERRHVPINGGRALYDADQIKRDVLGCLTNQESGKTGRKTDEQ